MAQDAQVSELNQSDPKFLPMKHFLFDTKLPEK